MLYQTISDAGRTFGLGPRQYATTLNDDGVVPLSSMLRRSYASVPLTMAGFLSAVPRLLRNPYFVHGSQQIGQLRQVSFSQQMFNWFELVLAAVHGDNDTVWKVQESLAALNIVLPASGQPAWLAEVTRQEPRGYSLIHPDHLPTILLPLVTQVARAHMGCVPGANRDYMAHLAIVMEQAFGVNIRPTNLSELVDMDAANGGHNRMNAAQLSASTALSTWREWTMAELASGYIPAAETYLWMALAAHDDRKVWRYPRVEESANLGSTELGAYGKRVANYPLDQLPAEEIFTIARR